MLILACGESNTVGVGFDCPRFLGRMWVTTRLAGRTRMVELVGLDFQI